jgi:hypothetical protein
MADWPAKKNAAFELQFPIYDADGDLVTAAAALDTELSGDGGTFADATNEATEIATSSGCYKVSLTAGEMNFDRVMTITKTSTGGAKTAVNLMYTVTRQLVDLAYPATSGRSFVVETDGMVHSDLKEWLGTAPLALVSQRVNTSVGAMAANVVTAAAIANAAIDAATFAAGAIDATAIATGAIDADALAADAVTKLRSLANGTADSGSASTLVDAALTEADTDYWKGCWLLITSGSAAGQVRLITGFNPATDTITVAPDFTQAITTNTYEILPANAVDVRQWLGSTVNALVSGRVDASAGAMAANVVTAAAIATDAVDADALAADAATEIADAILKRDIDQVEATAPLHSLTTAVLKAVSRIVDDAGTLKVYRTDGATLHMSQTITVNASADPIDELVVGV